MSKEKASQTALFQQFDCNPAALAAGASVDWPQVRGEAVRVYKYLPAESALKTIAGHKIKISEFADMNDPFELAGVVLSCPRVHKIIVALAHENGALCLSNEWNNPLMWSHYAEKHTGLCLGFEIGPKVEVLDLHYVETVQELSVDSAPQRRRSPVEGGSIHVVVGKTW
ncbi:MAG TPA: DUF2971 domain-containing protein [Bryobacteraceae bacterium]|nr:DUF2971 domain-containing protein [Bryobacteraceae bacterium]